MQTVERAKNPYQEKDETAKTKDQWNASGLNLTEFLQVGDAVDESLEMYFLEVLPPAFYSSTIIQIGEPYDHVDEAPTFMTIRYDGHAWRYAGTCHKGKVAHLSNR